MVKFLHILFVFIWVGALLMQTRLLGYHVREEKNVQMALSRIWRRCYHFIELPSMILAIAFGLYLFPQNPWQGWFYVKMGGTALLVGADLLTGKYVRDLCRQPDVSKGIKYKILHGVAGIGLIVTLGAIYILKPR